MEQHERTTEAQAAHTPPAFGLDRLSADAISRLFSFASAMLPREITDGALIRELQGMPLRNLEAARSTFRTLADSDVESDRILACRAVAYLAELDPTDGFALWQQLMLDPDSEVWEAATDALVSTLGRLRLDPEAVIDLIAMHYAAEAAHNRGDMPGSS